MKYPLLATDLDGTLLTHQREIDAETIEAIHEYRTRGGRVVICSGRSPLSTRWIARTIGLQGEHIIAYNGAILLDETGEIKEQATFQQESLLHFWELCEKEGIYSHFYEGDTLLVPAMNKWNEKWIENNILSLANSGGDKEHCERLRKQCQVKVVDNFYSYIKGNQPRISKIAVFDEGDRLYDFSQHMTKQVDDLEISSSLDYLNLEISPRGVTKAATLQKLAEELNIPIAQTAAIGDNYNDVQMLRTAGLGVAMGNAPDQVKQAANYVTGANHEGGIATAIRRYLLE